jgi:hypothetical protein
MAAMKRFLLSCLLLIPVLACAQNVNLIAANQVMIFAGLPLLPANAKGMRCVSWDTVSKGVYATWLTDEAGLDSFIGLFGEEITPIPENLLKPQAGWPAWLNPSRIENGGVVTRQRWYQGSRESIRVYVDRDNLRIYFSYSWG